MLVNITTDNNLRVSAELRASITSDLEEALSRYGERVTRVEVSLTDQNSNKKDIGDDKRCLLEARLAGVQPVTVTCDAAALDVAIEGAIDKLLRALEHRIDRNEDHKGRMPMSGPDGLSAEAEAE